jgi:hypothetical protein
MEFEIIGEITQIETIAAAELSMIFLRCIGFMVEAAGAN